MSVTGHGGYLEVILWDQVELRSGMRMYQRILDKTDRCLHLTVVQTDTQPDYCIQQIKWVEAANGERPREGLNAIDIARL